MCHIWRYDVLHEVLVHPIHVYCMHTYSTFLSLSLPEWRQFVYMGYEVILASQKMQPSNDRTRVQCNIIAAVDMYIDWR